MTPTAHDSSRRAPKVLALLVAVAALAAFAAAPASATADDSDVLVFVPYAGQTFSIWRNGNLGTEAHVRTQDTVAGDFSGAAGTDLFLYNSGTDPDGILHVAPAPGGGYTSSFRSETINGLYTPVVGDFDGNAIDDILWYGKGTIPDSYWLFQVDGSHTTKTVTINGDYRVAPINIDGDGDTDLIFYAPGSSADSIWVHTSGANHTTKAITINGDYTLIAGHFSDVAEGSPQRRLYFWSKAGADSIWTFDTSGNHTSASMPNVDGSYEPVVGEFNSPYRDSVLFYKAGTGSERLLSFNANGSVNQLEPPVVNGSYDPVVGDFDGNGYGDIAWATGGKATLWKFNGGGYTQASVTTATPKTFPATIANYLFPA